MAPHAALAAVDRARQRLLWRRPLPTPTLAKPAPLLAKAAAPSDAARTKGRAAQGFNESTSSSSCHRIDVTSSNDHVRETDGCACGTFNASDDSSSVPAAPSAGWGLPTASCPISPYLRDELPILHAQWLREKRVLYHCPDAGGLGDYMRGLPSAFLLSILLQLAFVLDCDVAQWSRGRTVRTNGFVRRFFVGPHFDWSRSGKAVVPSKAQQWRLKSNLMHNNISRAPSSTRVLIKPSASARRFVRINERTLAPLLGGFYVNASHDTTEGCFLRYLLAPSSRLQELALDPAMLDARPVGGGMLRRTAAASPTPEKKLPASWLATMGDGQRLVPAVTMHVRVGDHVFFRNASVAEEAKRNNAWLVYLNHTRPTPFTSGHAQRAIECLALASRTPYSGGRGAQQPPCLPCAIVADSSDVVDCARAALGSSVRATRGEAVHIAGSAPHLVTNSQLNKTFLDWWLLARSARIIFAGVSEFARTAARFQAATATDMAGGRIEASNISDFLEPNGRWRQLCDGSGTRRRQWEDAHAGVTPSRADPTRVMDPFW